MSERISKQKIILCTFSDFTTGSGSSINDKKLFDALPANYCKIPIYPNYSKNSKLKLKSIKKFYVNYLREIINSKNIFIIRGGKLSLLALISKKIFKNIIILNLGCTTLMFVERKAFVMNKEYEAKKNIFQKILYFFEFYIEKYALRQADKIIVENPRAKNLVKNYGAKSKKITIIPYYVQDYFLKGENPSYNIKNDLFKIGYTGRFNEHDLIKSIINSIEFILKNENFRIKLFLIGDGPTRKKMEDLVYEKGLTESIIFLGTIPHKKVASLVNDYHCLLYPMVNNLSPSTVAIKTLEGVMKGKIIITTNSGNNPSLFLEHTDLILKNPSSENIAEKIKIVIENYNHYIKIAEIIRDYHLNFRSKRNYEKKLTELFSY